MNWFVDWQNSLVLILSALNMGLGVFLASRSKYEYRIAFGLFAISAAIWCFGIAAFRATDDMSGAWFWLQLYYLAAAAIAPLFLNFVSTFPERSRRLGLSKRLLIYLPLLLVVLLVYFFREQHIEYIDLQSDPHTARLGTGYKLYAIWWLVYAAFGITVLTRKYVAAKGLLKTQMTYLYFGTVLPILLGMWFNLILPWLGDYSKIEWGPITTSVLIVIISYAILRYRLLDIQIILRRSLVYLLAYFTVLVAYSVAVGWVQQLLTGKSGTIQISELIGLLIVATTATPVLRLFERTTDKLFFRSRYDTQQAILELSKELSSVVSMEQLLSRVSDSLMETMRLNGLGIGTRVEGTQLIKISETAGDPQPYDDVLRDVVELSGVQSGHEVVILEEWQRKRVIPENTKRILKKLQESNIACVVPLVSKQSLIGMILLQAKKSGDAFTSQDIKLLELLSHNAAVALDNAMLYEDLERRIVERTQEVKQKNTYLVTLQRVMNEVIQSIDFKDLTQNIVDSVQTEMGYPGAFILNYEPITEEEVRLVAITDTPLIRKAFRQFGHGDYKILGHVSENDLMQRVVKDREVVTFSELRELLHPAIPDKMADTMQSKAGLEGFVAVPIVIENQTYGVLVILLDRDHEAVEQAEVEIMQALSHMVAIVIRNSHYYEEIQDSNKKLQNAYKMINQQLAQLEEANRHLQKLDRAKTEFLSIASHQLRTPLSAIRGYLSLLEEGDYGELSDKQKTVMQKTQENVKRLVSLVTDLLSLARIESGSGPKNIKFERLNLVEIIDQITDELFVEAKNKGIELIWQAPEQPVEAMIDREKIEQVVMNLIDNAIHYTPQGNVTVGLEEKDDEVVFSVKDTGIGIDEEGQKNLFTKFFRAQEAVKVRPDGTGIGLYVVKVMVETHGGRIWLDSEPGKGTTFFVALKKDAKPQATEEDKGA